MKNYNSNFWLNFDCLPRLCCFFNAKDTYYRNAQSVLVVYYMKCVSHTPVIMMQSRTSLYIQHQCLDFSHFSP